MTDEGDTSVADRQTLSDDEIETRRIGGSIPVAGADDTGDPSDSADTGDPSDPADAGEPSDASDTGDEASDPSDVADPGGPGS